MRPVINFNTGGGNYWTVFCIVFFFLEKLCYVGRRGSFLSAVYLFFFGVSRNFYFSHCFNFLVSILCCEGLFLLSCSSRGCFFFSCSSFYFFFFFGLLPSSSSFLFFCLLVLLSCSSVFFFGFCLGGDLLFNERASVTSFCKVLLQNISQTHKY